MFTQGQNGVKGDMVSIFHQLYYNSISTNQTLNWGHRALDIDFVHATQVLYQQAKEHIIIIALNIWCHKENIVVNEVTMGWMQ